MNYWINNYDNLKGIRHGSLVLYMCDIFLGQCLLHISDLEIVCSKHDFNYNFEIMKLRFEYTISQFN